MRAAVRRADPSDVSSVVELVQAYAREVFDQDAGVTTEALLDDGFGSVLEFCVAESPDGNVVGFAAWEKTYDVVAGLRGGVLLSAFVAASARGDGIGDALLGAVAHEVRAIGGEFLLGLGEARGSGAPISTRSGSAELTHLHLQAADVSLVQIESISHSLQPGPRSR